MYHVYWLVVKEVDEEWTLLLVGCRVSLVLEKPNWVLFPGHGSPGLLPLYSGAKRQ